MIRRIVNKLTAVSAAVLSVMLFMTPVQAQVTGGGPYGDIDGYYTWEINGKGWTVYSQNGYSWVYESNGARTYLDSYGNKLYGVTPAAARTITEMKLTYNSTVNGTTVYQNPNGALYTVDANGRIYAYGASPAPAPAPVSGRDIVVKYAFNSADGYVVYKDPNGTRGSSAKDISRPITGETAGAPTRPPVTRTRCSAMSALSKDTRCTPIVPEDCGILKTTLHISTMAKALTRM